MIEWYADTESYNGKYGVYECREDGDPGRTITVTTKARAAKLVTQHNMLIAQARLLGADRVDREGS